MQLWRVATNAENIRARDTKVIAAAWRLIASTGVASLTVKALANEAGVAPSPMLYTMPSQAVVRERAMEARSQVWKLRMPASRLTRGRWPG